MSRLGKVFSGKHAAPARVVLYGERGKGKTSFAAGAPNPIFIQTEDGQGQLDLNVLPAKDGGRVFREWGDILEGVKILGTEEHDYQTLVIDTIDAAYPALFTHVCATYPMQKGGRAKGIEDYGWGAGFQYAADEMAILLADLEKLRDRKAMNIIVIAHSIVKTFDPPDGESYSQYRLPGNDRLANAIGDWAGDLLFVNDKVTVVEGDRGKNKGKGSGERWLFTDQRPAFWAKNKNNLPPKIPFPQVGAWATYQQAIAEANK